MVTTLESIEYKMYMRERAEREEAARREIVRITPQFFMSANVRPATAQHYQVWLESYLDHGGKVGGFSPDFPGAYFNAASQSGRLPAQLNDAAFQILVPDGVSIARDKPLRAGVSEGSTLYSVADGTKDGPGRAECYGEMVPDLVRRGYSVEQLIPAADWGRLVDDTLAARVLDGPNRKGFEADLAAQPGLKPKHLRKMEAELAALDVTQAVLKTLGLPPGTPVSAEQQQIADGKSGEALTAVQTLCFKLDPDSRAPAAPFVKKAKAAEIEADVGGGISGALRVKGPLKLKSQDAPQTSGMLATARQRLKKLLKLS